MKILTPKSINLISGASLCEGYAQVLLSFEQQYKDYEIYRGWGNYYRAVKEYGSDNVPYCTVPSTQGNPYIVYTIIS